MPKRNCKDDNISAKLRKNKKNLKQCKRRRIISSSSEDSSQASEDPNHGVNLSPPRYDTDVDSILLNTKINTQTRWYLDDLSAQQSTPTELVNENIQEELELDSSILQILGDDPTTTIEYGKTIRPELVTPFNHIATNGLKKDARKELCDKYLIPENYKLIGEPILNPEIKVTLNENTLKRDKPIECRQKRIAAALSCIAEALSHSLEAQEKDNTQIKRLVDSARLICDFQYNDSISRRSLAVYSLKKEMKEPLLNTKIDQSLFGEQLSDSLKAAKAVAKFGTELKTQFKPQTKNWNDQVAGRRQPVTTRRNPPAAQTTPAQPAPPPAATAQQRNTRTHWSRKPPPPPQKSTRRRY